MICCFFATILTFRNLGQDYLVHVFGLVQPAPAKYLSLTSSIALVITPIVGLVLSRAKGKKLAVTGGMLLLLLGLLILLHGSKARAAIPLSMVLIGVGFGVVPVALWSAVGEIVPKARVSGAFAFLMASLNVAAAATGYGVGFVSTVLGPQSMSGVLSWIAGVGVILSLIWLSIERKVGPSGLTNPTPVARV